MDGYEAGGKLEARSTVRSRGGRIRFEVLFWCCSGFHNIGGQVSWLYESASDQAQDVRVRFMATRRASFWQSDSNGWVNGFMLEVGSDATESDNMAADKSTAVRTGASLRSWLRSDKARYIGAIANAQLLVIVRPRRAT